MANNYSITPRQNKERVILADDEEDIWEIYGQALKKAGFNVLYAKTGGEVIELLENDNISLIILDIVIPKLDGYDALKKLRKNKKFKDVPVIIFTNLDNPEDKKEAEKLGADEYLVKVNTLPTILVEKVRKYLLTPSIGKLSK